MPFADPEKRKQYDADFKRKARAAEPCPTRLTLPVEFRAKTAADVLVRRGGLNEQLDTLRQDASLGSVERAKAVGALAYVLGERRGVRPRCPPRLIFSTSWFVDRHFSSENLGRHSIGRSAGRGYMAAIA